MNTLEFRAAVRPQLEQIVSHWFNGLSVAGQRNVGVAFQNHMRCIFGGDKACQSVLNMLEALPLSLKTEEKDYEKKLLGQLVPIFLVSMSRYQHLDRSAGTMLKVRAYHQRMRNALVELHFLAEAYATQLSAKKATKSYKGKALEEALVRKVNWISAENFAPIIPVWPPEDRHGRPLY